MPKKDSVIATAGVRAAEAPNPPRARELPVVGQQCLLTLLIDTSPSMSGEPIAELNRGLRQLFKDVGKAGKLQYLLQVQLRAFSDVSRTLKSMGPIDGYEPPEVAVTGSGTAIGEAVNEALDESSTSRDRLASQGVPIRAEVLAVFSDGEGNGSPAAYERACARIHQLESKRVLSCFPIGVGPHAELKKLGQLSSQRSALRIADVRDFSLLFAWLLTSLDSLSMTRVGERVELSNPLKSQDNPSGWASVD
jgi:uncharacterized protein YegL